VAGHLSPTSGSKRISVDVTKRERCTMSFLGRATANLFLAMGCTGMCENRLIARHHDQWAGRIARKRIVEHHRIEMGQRGISIKESN